MRASSPGFQRVRLAEARTARSLTQTALSLQLGRAKSSVSKWESGQQTPNPDVIGPLADALNVPREYFFRPPLDLGDAPIFFRSMANATKRSRARLEVRLGWLQTISWDLQQWLDLPDLGLPDLGVESFRRLSDEDVEQAAQACRQHWGLGRAPIPDMLLVLENAGVVSARDEFGTPSIDGVSRWSKIDDRPYVLTASDKRTAVRSRFDAAHELAHLLLHRRASQQDMADGETFALIENQAHRFAAAFLLPAEGFANEVQHLSLDAFVALKSRWRVSVKAMIQRCRDLDLMSDAYAVRLYKYLSARGWNAREPLDDILEPERPRLLERGLRLLMTRGGWSQESLLSELRLYASDVEPLTGLPAGMLSRGDNVALLPTPTLKRTDRGARPAPIVPLRRRQ
ncbi:MAG: XRE family transcriptional regulator [Thiohalocapsa sp.]|uniref:helix-turn-helix domain-containing protein n=1 Tax=Thiohalocapsa sp. TaxID=2497641 RepID=UPI0025F10C27|nr:XRE family transcriptional regulator [Thiohalocapsa sp.]MCG6940874.1 XRE family transcriptional regulator [Thiohalocapsa sp.]